MKPQLKVGWFKSGKNDKLDILLLFRPDSESFGKWCLEKCKKFFDTTTLMPAESVPTFYYITHLCEIQQNRKFDFFQFFQKQNWILLFEYLAYIKNVIFWGTSCWCSSKFAIVWGGTHKLQSQLLSPLYKFNFWATSTGYTSKDHIFYVGKEFKQ